MDVGEFNKLFSDAVTNSASLEKLYSHFYPKIVLHISVKFGADKAEDIAQEFFKRLIDGKYKNSSYIKYPSSWIFRCCDNLTIDSFNTDAKYITLSKMEVPVDDLQFRSELREKLTQVFKVLSNSERRLIYLHNFEGYSLKELAPLLGMTYGSLKQKHHRIMKKLKKIDF